MKLLNSLQLCANPRNCLCSLSSGTVISDGTQCVNGSLVEPARSIHQKKHNSSPPLLSLASIPESNKSRGTGERTDMAQEAISLKGTLASLHSFNWPCLVGATLPGDMMPSRRPKGRGDKVRDHIPLTPPHLVFFREKVDHFPCRGLRQMLTPAQLVQKHVRGEGEIREGGTPALSHESSCISSGQLKWALSKGLMLSQLQHLAFCTSTQEKAALWPQPRQYPRETKVT